MNEITLSILEFFITYGEQMYISGLLFYLVVDMYNIEIVNALYKMFYHYKQNECAILQYIYVLTSIIQTCAIIGMLNNLTTKQHNHLPEDDFELQNPCGNEQGEPLFDTD